MTALPSHPTRLLKPDVLKRAALWLLFLAPFFYLTYGGANWLASQRSDVPNLAFEWEKTIPFWAWTIIPYWSINFFYGLSLFINDTPGDVARLAKRYLTAQIIAVACFVAFPIVAVFTKPETSGIPGFMFDVLGGFDKPFNQAPSLHIALLVIIWDHLRQRFSGLPLAIWHIWCVLIGVSVLTTYQHHFVDIPTGALLGCFALWLFPRTGPSPLADFSRTTDRKALKLARIYAAAALVFLVLTVFGLYQTPAALVLLWPALALAIVSAGYFGAGPAIFQKQQDGQVSLASKWLLMPYRLGVKINSFLWTRNLPASVEVAGNVHLGRFPSASELGSFATVIDMTGELIAPRDTKPAWYSFPTLDLRPIAFHQLDSAAQAIETARQNGPVLVCCALGFQRSAATVALWLLRSGAAKDSESAIALLASKGRRIHLKPETLAPFTAGQLQ